jgi:rhodanese-related sulfurtransferase
MNAQILEFSGNHPILVASFFALLGLILFTEFRRFTEKFVNVTPGAAVPIINKDDTVILDIRETNEIKDGKINDAIHIPLTNINNRLSEMDKHKDQNVVVYCRSGHRSSSVCRMLTGRGFEKVYNLSGGIMAWQEAHLPVSSGSGKKKKKK